MGYAMALGVPESPSGEGSQLVPPQPSTALVLSGDTRMVPRAPRGMAGLWATLMMARRKDSGSLHQAVGRAAEGRSGV